jgi:hypothetical protein
MDKMGFGYRLYPSYEKRSGPIAAAVQTNVQKQIE